MIKITVLDVSHGTSLVLESGSDVIIVDAGPGATLQEYLEHARVSEIGHVFISHADADHVNGLNSLMLDLNFKIGTIYVNPDPRSTNAWEDFRRSVAYRKEQGSNPTINALGVDSQVNLATKGLVVEILAPPMEDWLGGVDSKSLDGPKMDANKLSGIVRISHDGRHLLLAGGDAGQRAFETFAKLGTNLEADILLFPHHGGRPGDTNDLFGFGQQVTEMVHPTWTVFSIGRGRYENPHPDVLAGVMSVAPRTRVMCTELSRRCAPEDGDFGRDHLTPIPAVGRAEGHCCAGSLCWEFEGQEVRVAPTADVHGDFIDAAADSPLCRRT